MNTYYENISAKVAEFISGESGVNKKDVRDLINKLNFVDYKFNRELKTTK